MAAFPPRVETRVHAYASLILGLIGLALCWWAPLGMVISLGGLIVGIIGSIRGPIHTTYRRIAVAGAVFCLAVLIFDFVLAANGLVLITFSALR